MMPGQCLSMKEKTIRRKTVFDGRLLKVDVLEVELERGVRARREVLRHPGAAVVLVELPDGRIVLVRQYRKAVERRLLEAVAGGLEPGEAPAACAVREVREETGYTVERLRKLGMVYPAPGYTTERMHLFHAAVGRAARGKQEDDDERVETVRLAPRVLERMIRQGKIRDAKTIVAWFLWREKLAPGHGGGKGRSHAARRH